MKSRPSDEFLRRADVYLQAAETLFHDGPQNSARWMLAGHLCSYAVDQLLAAGEQGGAGLTQSRGCLEAAYGRLVNHFPALRLPPAVPRGLLRRSEAGRGWDAPPSAGDEANDARLFISGLRSSLVTLKE
jgi:hypothetical protein